MDEHDWLAERFEEHRAHLREVAYRMQIAMLHVPARPGPAGSLLLNPGGPGGSA